MFTTPLAMMFCSLLFSEGFDLTICSPAAGDRTHTGPLELGGMTVCHATPIQFCIGPFVIAYSFFVTYALVFLSMFHPKAHIGADRE